MKIIFITFVPNLKLKTMSKNKTVNVNLAIDADVHMKIKLTAITEQITIEQKYNSILKDWSLKTKTKQ
jgi:hypothetical protein